MDEAVGDTLRDDSITDSNIPENTSGFRKRALLYDSKGKYTQRRRTDTDIQILKSLLVSDEQLEADSASWNDLHNAGITESTERHESNFIKRRNNRLKRTEAERLRRQTVAVDGIYHARRAISVEHLSMSEKSDRSGLEHTNRGGMIVDTDSEDEFFLATDFVNPLPKSKYTQSVDYLDNLIREDSLAQQEIQRRCTSEYDIHDAQSGEYEMSTLQKDISLPSSSSNSLLDYALGKTDMSPLSDFDLESLPPESLVGSSAENMCPSPLGSFGDVDDWTPPHDPNVIHSAREARDFIAQRKSSSLREGQRCKSETYLLKRQRSRSFSMLSDEVYMDDIEDHTLFRRKLRAALGLDDATNSTNTSTDNLNTSLTFRLPHKKTNEQLHTRLRRVLSSVSINESLFSDNSDNDTHATVARYHNRRRGQRKHWRTKSMPSDVDEFIQSYNSNCNNSSQYYERSKSAEVLNHLGRQSAFSIYNDDQVEDKESSLCELEEDEIFIDSPLIVDYQLGRRQSLPVNLSTSSEDNPHTEIHSNNRCSKQSNVEYDSYDEEVTEALHQTHPYSIVRAELVHVGTPGDLDRSSIVHATPIHLGTPCQLSIAEDKQPCSPGKYSLLDTTEEPPQMDTAVVSRQLDTGMEERPLSPLSFPQIHVDAKVKSFNEDSNMHRQPMKPLKFDTYKTNTSHASPHDSLATVSSDTKGGTGYFLRFDNLEQSPSSLSKKEQKSVSPPKKSLVSPAKKPTATPKKPLPSSKTAGPLSKTPVPLPKKPSSPSKNSRSPVTKPTSFAKKAGSSNSLSTGRIPKVVNKPSSSSKAPNPSVKSSTGTPKKQGPAVKPKPTTKAKSKIPVVGAAQSTPTRGRAAKLYTNDGFRTRSVSPKVLKREDILAAQQNEESTIATVVDKCNKLLKNLQTDHDHISKTLTLPKVSSLSSEHKPTSGEITETALEPKIAANAEGNIEATIAATEEESVEPTHAATDGGSVEPTIAAISKDHVEPTSVPTIEESCEPKFQAIGEESREPKFQAIAEDSRELTSLPADNIEPVFQVTNEGSPELISVKTQEWSAEPTFLATNEDSVEPSFTTANDDCVEATSMHTQDSIAAQHSEQRIVIEDVNKRTNNYSNNNFSDMSDSAKTSRLVDTEVFIDLAENNLVNNALDHCLTDESNSEVTNADGVESLVVDRDADNLLDTTPQVVRSQSLPSPTTSTFTVFDPFTEDSHQSTSGCQELTDLTNSGEKNSTATLTRDYWNDGNEPERDTNNIDDGMVVGETLTTHLTQLQAESEVEQSQERQKEEPKKEFPDTKSVMASSWMDRLKEDLDNDDEWLSEEEDFQREQEKQLKAAAQRRALAEEESLSDDDETPEQYESRVSKKVDKEPEWSDEEVGFQGRNAPLRKSMNRNSYSPDEYSSEEELTMSAAARYEQEPGQEEMDMMVKKNLAYVNSKELDQMDIMTSDLDIPQHQLNLEAGVGEFVRPDEAGELRADENSQHIDAKEDSDEGDYNEVSGELAIVGDSEITADHKDVNRWREKADEFSVEDNREPLGEAEREISKAELISALAEDLKESDQQDMDKAVESLGPSNVDEEVLSPTDKYDLQAGLEPNDGDEKINQANSTDDSKDASVVPSEDYSTQVIRPNRNRGWRKQLSQKMNEWEDELPSPSRASDEFGLESEAVTSFMSADDADGLDENPPSENGHPPLDRSKSSEEEIREKVEDSMQDKIRDWKNMTAESVAGQVDEWQSLGNFNVPNSSALQEPQQNRRRAHEDTEDDNVPAEKRRDVEPLSVRSDSGDYADINTVVRQTSSYDGDAEGADAPEGLVDSDDGMEDGEGYVSDSSSQDTVRERSMHRQSIPTTTGSDDESADSPVTDTPAVDPSQEPGYVEILGGEEPPDEWKNLGTRRERISSSSSSSDGSGFQYIAAEPSHKQQSDSCNALAPNEQEDAPRRERLATPPIDLPVASHIPVEEVMQEVEYTDRQHSAPPQLVVEPLPTDMESQSVDDVETAGEPMSHAVEEVLTEDEDVVEVVGRQSPEQLSSPEPAPQMDQDRQSLPRSESASDSEPQEPAVDADRGPEPSARKDSFDRVEKLRKEMRSADTSGQSQSFDLQMTRQGRSAERFTERMISFEKSKAMRERKTPAPAGLSGKFSAVFSRFETDEGGRGRKSASALSTRSKSVGPPSRRNSEKFAEKVEAVEPVIDKQVKARAQSQPKDALKTRTASLSRTDAIDQPTQTEPKSRRVERSKTFDTGVPNRSPSGSKVIARMAKFGQSVDVPSDHPQTVTTKNSSDRFERHTVDNKSRSRSNQPHFDVDIQISREPIDGDSREQRNYKGTRSAAITVGRDKVKVQQVDKHRRLPSDEERREEYLNVWDTEVPVKDGNRKIISSKRLHVTSVNKKLTPSASQEYSEDLPLSRATSESKLRHQPSSFQNEEVSVTVRPQQATNHRSASHRSRQSDKAEQSRMRSSIALQPTDEVIQAKRASRQHANPESQRRPREPERDYLMKKADSLEDLRSGSLVAQCKGKFGKNDNAALYLPIDQTKAYSNKRNESFIRGTNDRHETMSDAVRDLVGAYDQMEEIDDYDIGYSRESLEYTRKWIENNETAPDVPLHHTVDIVQPHGRDRIADPIRDDANARRMRQANKTDVPKHFQTRSGVTMRSASPEPSVVSDRGRSAESNRQVKVGRPKGRTRSLPRRKPAKAIADKASVFSNPSDEQQPMVRPDIEDHIRAASAGRSMQSHPGRRSTSPRPISQKERLANRRSMPPQTMQQQREPNEEEQGSPRAASKGVAMMVELYNKTKAGDSVLADVDEQTLARVDDDMFRQSGMPTSPPVDESAASARAWKAWRGQVERSNLEQKIEHAYGRHTQQSGPPLKRESKPMVDSGWQQRSIHEDRLVRPMNASQAYGAPPQASPPRPLKSSMAADMQRRGYSMSPPAPELPHRGYSAGPSHPNVYASNQPPDNEFDSYKQQTLQRFRQEEQYATVNRSGRPEQPRQMPAQPPNSFDQALLMQAPPPKPERLYNKAEPWETYPPNEYPTTNSLQGYQPKPTSQYPSDPRAPVRYPDERQQFPAYPHERQPSQRDPRYRDYPPPPQQQRPPQSAPHPRYDDRGYPAQPPPHQAYRDPGYGHPAKHNYPASQSYREPGYDGRPHGPNNEPYHPSYPDQVDAYRQHPIRRDARYPHEQPPRGPIPDPRYLQSNGIRSPPPQQADPRYGPFDPRMEVVGRPPRRTNSVPNIKQQVMSSTKGHPPTQPYNPRYHDQYMEERQREQQSNAKHGSLPRSSKKEKSKKNKDKTNLPEFIPIQYATGKHPSKSSAQNGYGGHPKHTQNNNHPPAPDNNRYNHSGEHPYSPSGYPPSGHPYPSNGHGYPPPNGYHPGGYHGYPHDDPYAHRTRPGVGVIYNPDLGVSDF